MSARYLLFGGGLACHEAAKGIRGLDADGLITIVSEEPELPYNRPPLSKQFLAGSMPRERLFFPRKDEYERLKIETILGRKVTSLDMTRKVVRLDNGTEVGFDKILLATGGTPRLPPIAGGNDPRLHVLRTVADAQRIAEAAETAEVAVIIGAGFIGLELAATIAAKGVKVTVVERESRLWERVATPEASAMIRSYCEAKGVKFLMSQAITAVQVGKPCTVMTERAEVAGDFVVVGIGISPNVELAIAAELEIDNGIIVDQTLRTSHPDIYAAGDVCCYPDPYLGAMRRVEHWGHARMSGGCAGRNMAGANETYDHLSYVWSEIFGLRINAAGLLPHGCQIFVRGTYSDNQVAEFYVRDDVLVGCMTIGLPPRLFSTLKKIIAARTTIAGRESELLDADDDLSSWV